MIVFLYMYISLNMDVACIQEFWDDFIHRKYFPKYLIRHSIITGFYRTQYPASYTHKSLGRTRQFTLPASAGTQMCLLCPSLKSQIPKLFCSHRTGALVLDCCTDLVGKREVKTSVQTSAVKKSRKIPCFLSGPLC